MPLDFLWNEIHGTCSHYPNCFHQSPMKAVLFLMIIAKIIAWCPFEKSGAKKCYRLEKGGFERLLALMNRRGIRCGENGTHSQLNFSNFPLVQFEKKNGSSEHPESTMYYCVIRPTGKCVRNYLRKFNNVCMIIMWLIQKDLTDFAREIHDPDAVDSSRDSDCLWNKQSHIPCCTKESSSMWLLTLRSQGPFRKDLLCYELVRTNGQNASNQIQHFNSSVFTHGRLLNSVPHSTSKDDLNTHILSPNYHELRRVKRSSLPKNLTLLHPITFMDATTYITGPSLRLYDKFSLRFAIRTDQRNGIILFNCGRFGVDFIAFELNDAQIYFSFDMGSGTQTHVLTEQPINDRKWHTVELFRNDIERNILESSVDRGTTSAVRKQIKVVHGDRSKNFDLADKLYLGGLAPPLMHFWRQKLRSPHGYQGCLANFSVNDQSAHDIRQWITSTTSSHNHTRSKGPVRIMSGCTDRPISLASCENKFDGYSNASQNPLPYCLNGGKCLQMWSTRKCDCEGTVFTGRRCDEAGTTLLFGHPDATQSTGLPQLKSNHSVGYLRLTYTDQARSTQQDFFALGIQMDNHSIPQLATLLFIVGVNLIGDFLHLYINNGHVHLDCNFGAGPSRIVQRTVKVDDGYFHLIRGYRSGFRLRLEVDQREESYTLRGGSYGKQFNNQHSIWVGHAPNRQDFYKGHMTGTYYNGLRINDLAVGLTFQPFIQTIRYGSVKHVSQFWPEVEEGSAFKRTVKQHGGIPPQLAYSGLAADSASDADIGGENAKGPMENDQLAVAQPPQTKIPPSVINSQVIYQTFTTAKMFPNIRFTEQVNVWLICCLAGAGFIVMLSSALLIYRFHLIKVHRTNPAIQDKKNSDIGRAASTHSSAEHQTVEQKKSNIMLGQYVRPISSIDSVLPNKYMPPQVAIVVPSAHVGLYTQTPCSVLPYHSSATGGSVLYFNNTCLAGNNGPWEKMNEDIQKSVSSDCSADSPSVRTEYIPIVPIRQLPEEGSS